MKPERRKFVRYKVIGGAIYVMSRDSDLGGWLKNISKGGMALEYRPVPGSRMGAKSIISLSGHQIAFYLTGVPCKLIYDIQSIEENQTFRGQENRLCGLQYDELAEEMKEKLENLLEKMY